VKNIEDIQHGPFREILKLHNFERDIEIDYTAELPAYTGLGSSSSFIVCLLNTIHAYRNEFVEPLNLAKEAIRVERDILKEPVGCQDQTFAAVGGLNKITFNTTDDIVVKPISLPENKLEEFENHIMLFFTGIKRKASDVIKNQHKKLHDNKDTLDEMGKMVNEAYDILTISNSLDEFGGLLDKNWKMKKSLDSSVSNEQIDEIYEIGMKNGAYGGKLLGAGSGGFFLFFVEPKNRDLFRKNLSHLSEIPIKLSFGGTKILS